MPGSLCWLRILKKRYGVWASESTGAIDLLHLAFDSGNKSCFDSCGGFIELSARRFVKRRARVVFLDGIPELNQVGARKR